MIPMISEDFLVTSDHHKIAYKHYKSGHDKVVIITHGFYNSKDAVLLQKLKDAFLDEYDVFMFDFRGHGKSDGLFTWTSKENRDFKAALEYVKGKYKKVAMVAFSLGASIAINNLVDDNQIDSLVCVSAPSDPGKIDYQFWKLNFKNDLVYTLFTREGWLGRGFRPGPFWLKKEKPINNVSKLKIPILYIHGDKDWVVRQWHSEVLYEKTQAIKKIVIIKNGPHAEYLMKDSEIEFVREIKDWFAATMN